MQVTEQQFFLFMAILVRVAAIFLSTPMFSFPGAPRITKIGFSALLALLLFPVVDATSPDFTLNLISATVLVFKEILTGVTIGVVLNFLFAGFQLAGEYVGTDMGLSIAQEFDPNLQQQVSVIGRLQNILAVLIFLLIDGHHFVIEALAYSYRVLPLGTWHLSGGALQIIMRLSAQVFIIGIKVAAPGIVTLFLTSVIMGIIAKAVPQMNIFFVGFPLRIFVGLASLTIGFPLFIYLFKNLMLNFENNITSLLRMM